MTSSPIDDARTLLSADDIAWGDLLVVWRSLGDPALIPDFDSGTAATAAVSACDCPAVRRLVERLTRTLEAGGLELPEIRHSARDFEARRLLWALAVSLEYRQASAERGS